MHLRQCLLLFEDVVAFRKGGWFLSRQLLATDEVRTVAASLMQTARRFKRGGDMMRYGSSRQFNGFS